MTKKPDKQPPSDPLRACIEIGECRPRHQSRKDTTHWCRGRTGTPHVWTWHTSELRGADTETGERGYYVEHLACDGCGREKGWAWDRRRRCHCGEIMERREPSAEALERWGRRRYWMHAGGMPQCVSCGYQPSRDIQHVWNGTAMVLEHPRVRCQCEIAAEKDAKRAHYTRKFAEPEAPQ